MHILGKIICKTAEGKRRRWKEENKKWNFEPFVVTITNTKKMHRGLIRQFSACKFGNVVTRQKAILAPFLLHFEAEDDKVICLHGSFDWPLNSKQSWVVDLTRWSNDLSQKFGSNKASFEIKFLHHKSKCMSVLMV